MTQENISQKSYIIGVTIESILQNLSRSFYILLQKHVSPHPNRQKFWFPSYPDYDIDNGRLSYPIGTFEVTISEDRLTFDRGILNGSITLDIYTTSAAQMDSISSQVFNAIREEKYKTLWHVGVRKVLLDSMDQDHVMRGSETSVHIKTLIFKFEYVFDKGT